MHKSRSSLLRHGRLSTRLWKPRSYATTVDSAEPAVQVTTLPNRIRVATDSAPGHFSSLGLYVDAGSRFEWPEVYGVSHFLDRMAFKSTRTRTGEEMSAAVHSLGDQIMCSSSRETIMYQSSHSHSATPLALSLISDTVLNPSFLSEEIEAQRDAAFYEGREIQSKPDMFLPEVLHSIAYGQKGLGNSLLCPEDRVNLVDEFTLRTGMNAWYRPERMVIAGAGMHHSELVELADKFFSSLKSPTVTQTTTSRNNSNNPSMPTQLLYSSAPSVSKSLTRAASYLFPNTISSPPPSPLSPTSTYTGGHRFIHDPSAEFNHLYIAYEGVGIHDDDIYALATMQVLLGGGGSFSAGGPGKGMYSRLYTHILNHYPQIDHCSSFHHIYTDSSLFGLFASFLPAGSGLRSGNTSSQILPHLVHQLSLLLYTNTSSVELKRAKNQLKSSMIMALESRAVQVEDLGRQILVHGRRMPINEMIEKIDQVDNDAIRSVAARIYGPSSGGKPTVVCMGHDDTGSYDEVFKKYGLAAPS